MTTVPCTYCKRPVNPEAGQVWRLVFGWGRKSGEMVVKRQKDRWACDLCISRLRHGVSPHQESLM
jgi:hypothetical protein